jgi:transposase
MNAEHPVLSQSAHWIGIDVAKKTFDAALVRHGQKWPATPLAEIPVRNFARTPQGVEDFLQWLDALVSAVDPPICVRVIMEATGRYSTELALWMVARRASLAPAIAPPHQTAAFIASLGLRNKTDKLEARALGFYGMERQPPAYQPMSVHESQLRELTRYRDYLVRERVAAANRTDETSSCQAVQHMQRKRLRLLERDIARIEQQMRLKVDACPELKQDIALLCTIYGVGFITAATVRAELGDLRRFYKARQLTAYAGLNPSLRQSGTSVNGRPRMSKKGNPRVRQSLYLAAMVIIRGQNDLQRTYLRLREEGKGPMAALGAVMRKLLVLMRAILISGKPFEPLWKTPTQRFQIT